MTRTTTRSRARVPSGPELPPPEELNRLKLSPEVAWYLLDRGYELPTCPPKWKTPEPRDIPGAHFDPARVDKVLKAFSKLRHTQGQWAGRQLRPDPWQIAYILAPVFGWVRWDEDADAYVRIINVCYVDVPRKNGKALGCDTPVLTDRGWTIMAEVAVGDRVHTPDGSFATVVAASKVFTDHHCYEVAFSDGQRIVADAGHQWTLRDRYSSRPTVTVTTEKMAERYLVGARKTHVERRYSVPVPGPLGRPDADLPIEPYVLGAWLGDGETAGARLTSADAEVFHAVEDAGYSLGAASGGGITRNVLGLRRQLRLLGVLGAKHVPSTYLLASEKQRLALLQGLMDTDGTVVIGAGVPRCEFTTTLRTLADAVLFLVRSLGWKGSIREGRATLRGKDCGPKWRVSWCSYSDESPFRLARKTARLVDRQQSPARSRSIQVVGVKRVATRPTRCIEVDRADGMYLAGLGLIPTHNSTLSGGIAIYMTCADGEQGAQTITAATTEQQAGFVFAPLKLLAVKSPALAPHVKAHQKRIVHTASGSYVEVVSSAADAQHGANIHCGIVDELHIHKTPELVETIETGTGSRTQPLIVFITTADSGKPATIYARKRERIEKLADGTLQDETTYGVIWSCDKDDDPHIEATWKKANPGYGISPTRAYLRRKSAEAKQSPAELAAFLRLHLGLRTKQVARYITLEEWDRNAGLVVLPKLLGRQAYGGLDLGSTSDLTSLCWLFPDGRGGYDVLWRYWAPEASLPELDRRTAGSARVWLRRGWLVTTPGNVTDYAAVKKKVIEDLDQFEVLELAYDPWNATTLTNDLVSEGAPMIEVRQGYASMSPPLKELKRLLVEGTCEDPKLRHGGNPISRWMCDNLTIAMNPSGDVKPDKANATDKIDGMSALNTAMARAMHHQAVGPPNLWLGGEADEVV